MVNNYKVIFVVSMKHVMLECGILDYTESGENHGTKFSMGCVTPLYSSVCVSVFFPFISDTRGRVKNK